jgi:hypothetical protein
VRRQRGASRRRTPGYVLRVTKTLVPGIDGCLIQRFVLFEMALRLEKSRANFDPVEDGRTY